MAPQIFESFRPLTGILFFNYDYPEVVPAYIKDVSVPLRGFCFSTYVISSNDNALAFRLFPSPYGDFVFQRDW